MINDLCVVMGKYGGKMYKKPENLMGDEKEYFTKLKNDVSNSKKYFDSLLDANFTPLFNGYLFASAKWLTRKRNKRIRRDFWGRYFKKIATYNELINITFKVEKDNVCLKFAYEDDNYKKHNKDKSLSKICLDILKTINYDFKELSDFSIVTSSDIVNKEIKDKTFEEQKNYLIKNSGKFKNYDNFYFMIVYSIKYVAFNNDDYYIEKLKEHLPQLKKFYELFYELLELKLINNSKQDNQNKIEKVLVKEDEIKNNKCQYWIYSPGEQAVKWEEFYKEGKMAIQWSELGDLSKYSSKEDIQKEMNELYDDDSSHSKSACMTWDFSHEINVGDIIFVKKGRTKIVGRGVVTSDYIYDVNRNDDYNSVRKVNWTHKVNYDHPGQAVVKTLTNITSYPDYVLLLENLFNPKSRYESESSKYTKSQFLKEVYIDDNNYDTIVSVLMYKKNIILQGPPGVGKTFMAKRLAYSIMGEKDESRINNIQFHQSYSYEDFVMGFKPNDEGFYLKTGCFYDFCKKAEKDSERDYFFIIDEINRGNLSKIFGELFMLIENDKRGDTMKLIYQDASDEDFSIPKNLYIIGMMNTADRSLAMLDYALRRRFSFIDVIPAFDNQKFIEYKNKVSNYNFDKLINKIQQLNNEIKNDDSLGEGFMIGHSYFCGMDNMVLTNARLSQVIEFEIIPLLKEYWFDEPAKVNKWIEELRGAIK